MIAIGSDHRGYNLKVEIEKYLDEKGIEYRDCGTFSEERADYPNIAEMVAKSVQKKECEQGILICGTGIGMCIVANKFKGIRAANVHDEYTARFSKLHNDANIMTIGAENMTVNNAINIVRTWIANKFEAGRHENRLELITKIEDKNMK